MLIFITIYYVQYFLVNLTSTTFKSNNKKTICRNKIIRKIHFCKIAKPERVGVIRYILYVYYNINCTRLLNTINT